MRRRVTAQDLTRSKVTGRIKMRPHVTVTLLLLLVGLVWGQQQQQQQTKKNFSSFSSPRWVQTIGRAFMGDINSIWRAVGWRSTISAKMTSDDEDADDDGKDSRQKGQYEAMCLLPRSPRLSQPPMVHFFAANEHSSETTGCDHETSRVSLTEEDSDLVDWIERELKDENYQSSREATTYVLIHGFQADWRSDNWMCQMKDLILSKSEQANVFIVDWSGGSKPMLPIDYGQSVANTRQVATRLARFLAHLSDKFNGDNKLHLVGHSLGAHISGFVGFALGPNRVDRITGLDPAGPCFTMTAASLRSKLGRDDDDKSDMEPERRLSPASARQVLALHTDTPLFGLNENCAHLDAYVNGGRRQPSCLMDLKEGVSLTCQHSYAHDLLDSWPEAVGDCRTVAYACRSWSAFRRGECSDPAGSWDLSLNSSSLKVQRKAHEEDFLDPLQLGRHFVASGTRKPHCLYHYQVLVAISKRLTDQHFKYYLEIPLEDQQGRHHRLVEVSNTIMRGSNTHSYLEKSYLPLIRNHLKRTQNGDQKPTLYYSTLITFASVERGQACNTGSDPGWPLCQPLEPKTLNDARLWVTNDNEQVLKEVEWVALNYMSSSDERERLKYTLIMRPNKQQLSNKSTSPLGGLVSNLATQTNAMAMGQQIDCRINSNQLANDAECNLIERQLRRSLKLVPV